MTGNRIYSLDYLRGLTAIAIMAYHFSSWTFGSFEAESFLGRIGLYGVSVFYVLSGLTLFLIYHKTLQADRQSLLTFGLKRLFRILPLLWVTVAATVILNPGLFDLRLLLLSLTGLFGFLEPAGGLGTGVWSIGNELVFYAFFPVLILLLRRHASLFLGACLGLAAVSIYFAFFVLDPQQPLAGQWTLYVNPFNQVILFVGGMLLGYFSLEQKPERNSYLWPVILLALALLAFTFYPVAGNRIALVTGGMRLVFIALSFMVCGAIYAIPLRLPAGLHGPLALTGEISYGLYLLHPLVFTVVAGVNKFFKLGLSPVLILLLAATASFGAAYLVFRFYEKPFISLGKRLTVNLFITGPKK
ncbi:MAG TPA: acyltransferase [Adhaeribacter sp.]|nr:acyltransferase [Adhaeribacter sp.]